MQHAAQKSQGIFFFSVPSVCRDKTSINWWAFRGPRCRRVQNLPLSLCTYCALHGCFFLNGKFLKTADRDKMVLLLFLKVGRERQNKCKSERERLTPKYVYV